MINEIKLYLKQEKMIYIFGVIFIIVSALPDMISNRELNLGIFYDVTEPFYGIGLFIIMIIIWAILDNAKPRQMKLYLPVSLKGQIVYDYIKIAILLLLTHWTVLLDVSIYIYIAIAIYMMTMLMFFKYYSSSLIAAAIGAYVSFNGINIIIDAIFALIGIDLYEVSDCWVDISWRYLITKSILYIIISIIMIKLTFKLADKRDITKGGAYYSRAVRIFVCTMTSFMVYVLFNGKTHFMNSLIGLLEHFCFEGAISCEPFEERARIVAALIFGIEDFAWVRCIIISVLVFIGTWKLTGLKGRRS